MPKTHQPKQEVSVDRRVDRSDDHVIDIPLDPVIKAAILEGGGEIHVLRRNQRTASPKTPGHTR